MFKRGHTIAQNSRKSPFAWSFIKGCQLVRFRVMLAPAKRRSVSGSQRLDWMAANRLLESLRERNYSVFGERIAS